MLNRKILFPLVSLAVVGCAIGGGWALTAPYQTRFFPGTVIDGQSIGGLTVAEAKQQLNKSPVATFTVYLRVDDIQVASSSSQLGASHDVASVVNTAFAKNQSLSIGQKLQRILHLPIEPVKYSTKLSFEEDQLREMIDQLKKRVDIQGEAPNAKLGTSQSAASLKILVGKPGRQLQVSETLSQLKSISIAGNTEVVASVASTSAALTTDELAAATQRASKLVKKKVILRAEDVHNELNDQDLIKLLAFPSGLNTQQFSELSDTLTAEINRPPQDAVFEYDKTTFQVSKFEPARSGLSTNATQLQRLLGDALQELEQTDALQKEIQVPVAETPPEVSLASTNSLGIQERIGFGESEYEHSIPNRIHNVALTAARINNTVVLPGAEFSFNDALGDVSAETGFKSAYVIRNGKTELGDGGGVCQVSTTLFRALLDGGIPITKRRPHSYRVSYYELNAKPGIDATVYAGDVDLRFKNDTGHAILIHTQTDSKKLYMNVELYGTSDGRTAEIVDHKTYDFIPAPPPLYIDDPTLQTGVIKQIDFAASGIKASFKNVVKNKAGDVIREDTYFSNYKPWQAVYLRGTAG